MVRHTLSPPVRGRAGRGTVGKTAVAGAKDRDTGQIAAEVVPDTKADTLQGFDHFSIG